LCDLTHRSTHCHGSILGAWHLFKVKVSHLSAVSNALRPLVTCCECCDGAVGLETIRVEGDTLLETLDDHTIFLSNECLREEINGGDECGELHGVRFFDSLNIHGFGVLCHNSGHYTIWHMSMTSTTAPVLLIF